MPPPPVLADETLKRTAALPAIRDRSEPSHLTIRRLDRRPYVVVVQHSAWTVTLDFAFPAGVVEIPDESIHRFLDSIKPYRGALNLGRRGHRGLAVTVSVDDADLEASTFEHAARRGEAIVRRHLPEVEYGAKWMLESIEVCANDEHVAVHVLPVAATV